jgi:hypothetical protein
MQTAYFLLNLISMIGLIYLSYRLIYLNKITWFTVIILFTILDFYIPSFIDSINFQDNLYIFNDKISRISTVPAFVFFCCCQLVFILFYLSKNKHRKSIKNISISKKLILSLIFFTFLIKYLEIISFNDFQTWFLIKSTQRFSSIYVDSNIQNVSLYNFSVLSFPIFYRLTLALIFLREITSNKSQKTYWIMLLLLAIFGFFRGAIIHILILWVAAKLKKNEIRLNNLIKLGIGGFMIISIYGAFRDRGELTKESYQESLNNIFAGHGYLGFNNIYDKFGNKYDYMYGKTYIDMLLLPVPRSIYTSKPLWYGIDDINNKLGYPKTTQTSVTWPGELFANFGWFGILLVPLIVFVFIMIEMFIMKFSYPEVLDPLLIPVAFVFNWMSFTGLVNSVIYIFPIVIVIYLMKKYKFIKE